MDDRFAKLGDEYLSTFAEFSPVSATLEGDHRFDHRLDDVGPEARQRKLDWLKGPQRSLQTIDRSKLSRANQVDYALLTHSLVKQRWELETLREWEWNPLVYSGIGGDAIYGLMARDYAAIETRLDKAEARLRELPRFFGQVRETLRVERVPEVHARTALGQTHGMRKTIDNLVRRALAEQTAERAERVNAAIAVAEAAIDEQITWIEEELIPHADGDYRLGPELYDQKLAFALHSSMTREQIREAADTRVRQLHAEMYALAKPFYAEGCPDTELPDEPDDVLWRGHSLRVGAGLP